MLTALGAAAGRDAAAAVAGQRLPQPSGGWAVLGSGERGGDQACGPGASAVRHGDPPLDLVPVEVGDRFPVNFSSGFYRQPRKDERPCTWQVVRVVGFDKGGRRVAEQKIGTTRASVVEAKLTLRWSPQQIAGWLPLAYPQESVMRVSHETIYLSLFVQGRGALRRELQRCLRTGRAMRYPRTKRLPQGRGQLRDTLHISQRPPEAADRAVPGHWEGDLVFGRRPSAVGTWSSARAAMSCCFRSPTGLPPSACGQH